MSSFTVNGNAVYLHICGRAICLPSQLMVMLYIFISVVGLYVFLHN